MNLKRVAVNGDLTIVLVHAGQLDPHQHILRRFFQFTGQQSSAWKRRKRD
jgi:hypothetical protein